ncbi:N-methyl-L-tryptophan oxidase [Aquamicrobium sp. LC103]|uniref:N-methyl-L-tryptophan oxidase n=1 Tax=Aquamicrobium sp. LC103 TaxID=1120658 RepID=UPI00063EAC93|nr:N-methyl-L-tryptophan oxidase [Aquamicrobium sp. LC103]TKT79096.1 N-methyl-L-tryptophan oxidase [Aquamicrobium sp. LC103]
MVYDVAVVGLGAMGAAALCDLARRGKRVLGLERFERGHARGSSHGESRAIRLGYFEHPSYVPLARAAYERWYELERLTGRSVLSKTGVLEIGRPGSVIVAGSLAASRLHGLPHEVLDAAEIARRYPQFMLPRDYSAVWQPDGGFVRPELGNELHLRLAEEAGARSAFGAKVTAIEPGPSSIRIRTRDGDFEAASVVIAAGAWIGDLVPALAPKLTTTRQVLCWFRAHDPEAVKLGALPVFIVDGEEDIAYGFPDIGAGLKCASHHDSGVWSHADEARQDAGPADEARMRRFLESYLPAGAGALAAMQTCIYTKTPDEDFVIDLHPQDRRIVVASPCSGHGYKFASVIGEVLADLAIEGETQHDISRFGIGRLLG